MKLCHAVAVLTAIVIIWAMNAAATVKIVRTGGTYATITGAVAATLSGDRLNISTGTYVENVKVDGKALTIEGGYALDCVTPIPSALSLISAPGGVALAYVNGATGTVAKMLITGATGSAVLLNNGSFLTLNACLISGNHSMDDGGGLWIYGNCRCVLTNTVLYSNWAQISGGGIYVNYNSTVELVGTQSLCFANSAYMGGGVSAMGNSRLLMHDAARVHGNWARNQGGGVMASNAAIIVDTGASIGSFGWPNYVTNSSGVGGGIWARNATVFLTNGGAVAYNTAQSAGGGIWGETNCTVIGGAIRGNTATNYSGGVFCQFSTVRDCLIESNTTYGTAGAIYSYSGTISNCEITANTSRDGAGLYGVLDTISCCSISSNTASGNIAGVFAIGGMVDRCVITRNYANQIGGAYGSATQYRNCLIAGNVASAKWGGYLSDGYGKLENCTIVGNSALDSPGATFGAADTNINTVIYNNGAQNWVTNSPAVAFFYCCTTPGVPGPGSITNNPMFVDRPNGDYHLDPSSPCRETGISQPWMAGAKDLDGNDRVVGGMVDMGCFEAVPEPAAIAATMLALVLFPRRKPSAECGVRRAE